MSCISWLSDTQSVGGGRWKEEQFAKLKRVKEVCEAQAATMRHFEE